jgi:hypothetical protein
MKRFLLIIIAICLFSVGRLFAQDASDIENAFQKANISLMSDQISPSVDLILPSEDSSVNHDECVILVTRFLRSVSPKDFTIIHQGNRGETKFMVCSLTTARGNYRVHLLFKKVNTQYLISQIRIEPSNE